jgi:AraC-like DNA-binding protein
VCAHLYDRYGNSSGPQKTLKGGLTPRQAARAEAYIREYFASDIGLNALALQCDLSRAHFAKAFKTSFGVTPHQ